MPDDVTGEHLEQEVKLDVWPGFRLPELVGLGDGVAIGSLEASHLVAVYHDTADLRLARSGISLRYREGDGTGWTLKLPADVADLEGAVSRRESTFEGEPEHVPSPVLDRVSAWRRSAVLVPVARMETERRTIRLTDPDGTLLAELVDDEVSAYDDDHLALRFREVEVEAGPADGAPGVVAAVVERLVEAGARPGGHRSKIARVLGPRASEPGDLDVPELGDDPTVCDVVRSGLARSVLLVVSHDAGARAGLDTEAVHQARVGTRRLRSDLQAFGPILLPAWASSLREELSWLADAYGDVRDADVLLERLEGMVAALGAGQRGAGSLLVERLRAQRDEARAHLIDVLDDQRYLDLLDRLVEAVRHPAVTSKGDSRASKVLPALAAEPWHRLRRAVDGLGDDPAVEDLHKVRIRAKRARYAAELASLSEGKPARRFAKAIAGLQDVLGALNDATVSEAWLRSTVADVPPGPAAVALELAQLEHDQADRLQREWGVAWKALDAKGLRAWLRR